MENDVLKKWLKEIPKDRINELANAYYEYKGKNKALAMNAYNEILIIISQFGLAKKQAEHERNMAEASYDLLIDAFLNTIQDYDAEKGLYFVRLKQRLEWDNKDYYNKEVYKGEFSRHKKFISENNKLYEEGVIDDAERERRRDDFDKAYATQFEQPYINDEGDEIDPLDFVPDTADDFTRTWELDGTFLVICSKIIELFGAKASDNEQTKEYFRIFYTEGLVKYIAPKVELYIKEKDAETIYREALETFLNFICAKKICNIYDLMGVKGKNADQIDSTLSNSALRFDEDLPAKVIIAYVKHMVEVLKEKAIIQFTNDVNITRYRARYKKRISGLKELICREELG